MATNQEKQEIRKQAKNGQSVNQITEKLGLPKSTVYYHFKKEVGQKQKEKALKIPKNPETQGELCGIFAGDGNFYKRKSGHYRIQIFLNYNDRYWRVLEKFLAEELAKKPMVFHNEEKSLSTIRYNSKALYELFKTNLEWGEDKTATIQLKDGEAFSRDFKKGFVRGLIDTDGYKEKKFRRYIYGTVSPVLRENFSEALSDFEIEHTNYFEEAQKKHWKTMHKTRITGDMAEKFNNIMEPRHPKKQYKILDAS